MCVLRLKELCGHMVTVEPKLSLESLMHFENQGAYILPINDYTDCLDA